MLTHVSVATLGGAQVAVALAELVRGAGGARPRHARLQRLRQLPHHRRREL